MNDAAPPGVGNFEFTANGRNVYCVTEGAGDEVFILVPGYAADHTTWIMTQPALAAKGKVYAPDLPGAGLSSLDVGLRRHRLLRRHRPCPYGPCRDRSRPSRRPLHGRLDRGRGGRA